MTITIMGQSAQQMGEGIRGRRALRAGILLGLIVGFADGIAVLIENPNSFTGLRSPAAFVAASVAMHLVLGAALGGLLALTGIARRISATTLLAIGLGFFLFLWIAIRVHVHWFFGEPLTSTKSLPAYVGVFVVSLLVSFLFARGARRFAGRGVAFPWEVPASAFIVLCSFAYARGRSEKTPPPPPNDSVAPTHDILLITLDTTRADHLSCYGYPRGTTPEIDRLARNAIAFENAYASIPLTNPSHVAMFTGGPSHNVRNNGMPLSNEIPTFVEALHEEGWNCAAFVSGIPLKAQLSGLAGGFTVYDDQFSVLEKLHPMLTTLAVVRLANRVLPLDFVERPSDRTVAAAVKWLKGASGPRFLWVHLFDPHTPYAAPRLARDRFHRESVGWTASGKPVDQWPIADYDAEIRTMDRHVGNLLREFRESAGDRGVVVLTADHGEGLEQHGDLTHGKQLYEEDLRVPAVVSGPVVLHQAGWGPKKANGNAISREFIPNSYVASWIRDAAGIESDRSYGRFEFQTMAHGDPIFVANTYAPEGREDKTAALEIPQFGDSAGLNVDIDPMRRKVPRRKLIVNWHTGKELAFDLWEDPGEVHPINPSERSWEEYRQKAKAWRVPALFPNTSIDPEVERRLKSLGYIH